MLELLLVASFVTGANLAGAERNGDAALAARVRTALAAERSLAAGGIAVHTHEGRVALSGFVPSADMASRAGRVTASVGGVRTVRNDIAVK